MNRYFPHRFLYAQKNQPARTANSDKLGGQNRLILVKKRIGRYFKNRKTYFHLIMLTLDVIKRIFTTVMIQFSNQFRFLKNDYFEYNTQLFNLNNYQIW